MKRLYFPVLLAVTVLFFAFSSFKGQKRINCTELNGLGCVCHVIEPSPRVKCWVTGPQVLKAGQTAYYKMFLTGGPALGGGYNVAVRFGLLDTLEVNDSLSVLVDNELTQKIPLLFPTTNDTIFWLYKYTAPEQPGWDTMYSCGLSTNNDGNPTDADEWAFGPKYPIKIVDELLPVELTSFAAKETDTAVLLTWHTATETNNRGFSVEQRMMGASVWATLGFVPGAGTTIGGRDYQFRVPKVPAATTQYRLRQADFDGSEQIAATVAFNPYRVQSAALLGNYPNPFNPVTTINYYLPEKAEIEIGVYGANGELLQIAEEGLVEAGAHSTRLNCSNLSSGTYFYMLRVNGIKTATGKMLLIK